MDGWVDIYFQQYFIHVGLYIENTYIYRIRQQAQCLYKPSNRSKVS